MVRRPPAVTYARLIARDEGVLKHEERSVELIAQVHEGFAPSDVT